MNITIDGKIFGATAGQTVLDVARENDIYIPTLCHHKKTGGVGRCRACVVEIEGMRGLQTSCTIFATDGMKVRNNAPAVTEARRLVVDLLLSSGRHDCLACEKSGVCELQDAAYHLGIERPTFESTDGKPLDDSSEFIIRDDSKCINCGRCVAACNSSVVNEVLGNGFRSSHSKVICDNNIPMGSSTCVQCGECVQLCPTGALTDKKAHGKGRSWQLEKVNTTCPYCGVGCQVTLHTDKVNNRIVKVTGREVAPNDGMLCVKGRYAYDFPSSDKRLKYPMVRKNGELVRVSWEEALNFTADKIREITSRDGADVFSMFGSGRITNENNYAVQKFTRAVIGTNNVDHCART